MPINPTTQLVILLYEYLTCNQVRLYNEYIQALDEHYRLMFQRHPEKYVTSEELFRLAYKKAQLEEFERVQKDIHNLLKTWQPGQLNNPDE